MSSAVFVRILRTPPGEAPLEVREAWVGLVLPVWPGDSGPRRIMTTGVLTGPRDLFGFLVAFLRRKYKPVDGFRIDGAAAVRILDRHDAAAAAWWRANAPAYVAKGGCLVFHAHVCEVVDAASHRADDVHSDDTDDGGPFTRDAT